jgi:hypothetical protein
MRRRNPRGVTGKLMVHVPGGVGFLLDGATSFVGQSAVLVCRHRRSVLAKMEKQNC